MDHRVISPHVNGVEPGAVHKKQGGQPVILQVSSHEGGKIHVAEHIAVENNNVIGSFKEFPGTVKSTAGAQYFCFMEKLKTLGIRPL